MTTFGLIGKNIDYSFSRAYFNSKFSDQNLECNYVNFDLKSIEDCQELLKQKNDIKGFNVTIPYKETIIPLLDSLSVEAKEIGAVNTIKITEDGKIIGCNTDYYGFTKAIKPYLNQKIHKNALIFGTGGSSKAVAYALQKLNIKYNFVSRTKKKGVKFIYEDLNKAKIKDYNILINCTPLGTSPHVENCPPIPYQGISKDHLLFDLIYNPKETTFLKRGRAQKAIGVNGLKMLEYQAEKAWEIWAFNL